RAATGSGGAWSYATALELLGATRWLRGDRIGALHDLEDAEALAASVGSTVTSQHARALRAVLLAADGDPDADRLVRPTENHSGTDEVDQLHACTRVLV